MPDRTRPGIKTPAHTINVIHNGRVKSATGLSTLLSNESTTKITNITTLTIKYL